MIFNIVTDSTADLPESWTLAHDMQVLGLTVTLDGITYQTVGDKRLTSSDLLEKMREGSQPSTSQINVGEFENVFRQSVQIGKAVLYIAFSSVLSGTYQSAVMARDLVLEDFPDAVIEILDTQAASMGEGYLVMKAVAVRDEGGSLEEVKAKVLDLAPRLRTLFLVDDLNHLMRGGRISKASALIGGLVNIKPIIAIKADGYLGTVAKVRGKKKAKAEFIRLALDDLADSTLILAYSDDLKPAEELRVQLLENPEVKEVLIYPLGPVISTHVGPGTLALFSIGKTKRTE